MVTGTTVLDKMKRLVTCFTKKMRWLDFGIEFGKGMLEGQESAFDFLPVKNLLKFEQDLSVGKPQFTQA